MQLASQPAVWTLAVRIIIYSIQPAQGLSSNNVINGSEHPLWLGCLLASQLFRNTHAFHSLVGLRGPKKSLKFTVHLWLRIKSCRYIIFIQYSFHSKCRKQKSLGCRFTRIIVIVDCERFLYSIFKSESFQSISRTLSSDF